MTGRCGLQSEAEKNQRVTMMLSVNITTMVVCGLLVAILVIYVILRDFSASLTPIFH